MSAVMRQIDVLVVGGGPGGPVRGGAPGEPRSLDARLRRARAHRRSGSLHRRPRSDSFDDFDLPRRRDAQHADDRAVRLAVRDCGRRTRRRRRWPPSSIASAFDRALAERADGRRRRDARRHAGVGGRDRAAASCGRLSATTGCRRGCWCWPCGANYAVPAAVRPRAAAQLPAYGPARACRRARLGDVELHFGHDIAPGGFAWAVPIVARPGTVRPRRRDGVRDVRSAATSGCWRGWRSRGASTITRAARGRRSCRSAPSTARIGDRMLVDRRRRRAGQADHRRRHPLQHSQRGAGGRASRSTRSQRDRLDAEALAVYERAWRDQLGEEFEEQHSLRDRGHAAERSRDRQLLRAGPDRRHHADRPQDGAVQPPSSSDSRAAPAPAGAQDPVPLDHRIILLARTLCA